MIDIVQRAPLFNSCWLNVPIKDRQKLYDDGKISQNEYTVDLQGKGKNRKYHVSYVSINAL